MNFRFSTRMREKEFGRSATVWNKSISARVQPAGYPWLFTFPFFFLWCFTPPQTFSSNDLTIFEHVLLTNSLQFSSYSKKNPKFGFSLLQSRVMEALSELPFWGDSYGVVRSQGIMWKIFSRCRKVLGKDTSWRSDDSTSFQQLGPDFDNRVAQLVTYCLLVTQMNMAEHESITQYKRINQHITYFTIDWCSNRLLASTLLSFKHCVLVNQL